MKRPTLIKKILSKFLFFAFAGFLTLSILGRYHFNNFYQEEKFLHLKNIASTLSPFVVKLIEENQKDKLQEIISKNAKDIGQRISVILTNGTVIADSNKDPKLLDDHKERPEIIEALNGQIGKSYRYSDSIKKESLYVAVPLYNNGQIVAVLRHSYILNDLLPVLKSYTSKVLIGTLILAIFVTLLLTLISRGVSSSLERIQNQAHNFALGNFEEPIPSHPEDTFEINALVKSLNDMASRLGQLFEKIKRKRNEREAILSNMSEGVLSVYMDNTIFHWNKSICDFLEAPYSEYYKREPLLNIFRNQDILEIIEKTKKEKKFIEEDIKLPSGKILQVHSNIIKKSTGEDLAVLMVFNDITRVRELEGHRKDFVANVSHELRTPLTSIQGYIENLLDERPLPKETQKQFLQTIQKNSERLYQIIENLLKLSELDVEKGNNSIKMEKINLHPILESAISSCQRKAHKKDIVIELSCEDQIDINANTHLLEQAFINILDNAIKYSEPNTSVSIKTNINQQSKFIEVNISDQGVGIPEEHLERLFERFYSANKARSRELGGSGLGLSIVKNILLAHSGSVSVKSKHGEGSIFTIKLPILTNS